MKNAQSSMWSIASFVAGVVTCPIWAPFAKLRSKANDGRDRKIRLHAKRQNRLIVDTANILRNGQGCLVVYRDDNDSPIRIWWTSAALEFTILRLALDPIFETSADFILVNNDLLGPAVALDDLEVGMPIVPVPTIVRVGRVNRRVFVPTDIRRNDSGETTVKE